MSETIHQLVLRSISKENYLGSGVHAHAFALPLEGANDDYILRVDKQYCASNAYSKPDIGHHNATYTANADLKHLLQSSSALTSPAFIAGGKNYGQPLLKLNDGYFLPVTIRKRRPGENIAQLEERLIEGAHAAQQQHTEAGLWTGLKQLISPRELTEQHSILEGRLHALQALNGLSKDQFIRFMKDVYALEKSNAPCDFYNKKNILFAPDHGIQVVDALYKEAVTDNSVLRDRPTKDEMPRIMRKQTSEIISCLGIAVYPHPPVDRHKNRPKARLEALEYDIERESTLLANRLKDACEHVIKHPPHVGPGNNTVFVRTQSNHAVALDAPSRTLLETLRNLEDRAQIAR
jgi:hypothetical protein